MASINKLAIRGVRSFSPEDEEQVRFLSCVVALCAFDLCLFLICILLFVFKGIGILFPGHYYSWSKWVWKVSDRKKE